jgi:HK97 family phage portal protein
MPFVQSAGSLRPVERPVAPAPYSLRISSHLTQDYATIWRTQPAVRTVIDFLARNIAQLGLHVFRRVSDTDRERLVDHPLAELISRPAPPEMKITRYRLVDSLIHDLGIYDDAFWLKVKAAGSPGALVRIPPWMVEPIDGDWLSAGKYRVRGSQGHKDFPADQVVHFRGYNPTDPRVGSSPIETLRRILAEEHAATVYRDQLWRNGARFSGYIKRPVDAPDWSGPARNKFRQAWQAQYVGDGPQAGGTPILEDGMDFTPAAVTPQQAQYLEARKLTREEVAAAYHIPLPMVGILDHATFSNITEQHKQLYQDTLGPWLTMICEDIALQLLPDLDDSPGVYVEFNMAEKLRGSFEEQAQQLQTSVGAPYMTRNEARARLNLPQIDGGDALVTPLNVLVGGQASPRDSAPEPAAASLASAPAPARKTIQVKARAPETVTARAEQVLSAFFERQGRAIVSKVGAEKAAHRKAAVDEVFDEDRWNNELSADLLRLNLLIASAAGVAALEEIGVDPEGFDDALMVGWLAANAAGVATGINTTTKDALVTALRDLDPVGAIKTLFEAFRGGRAKQIATDQTSAMSGFGTVEAVRQIGGENGAVKTWVTGSNPRPSHRRMDGQTVGIDEVFSNGARWPGDSNLRPEERANCNCALRVSIDV